MEKVIKSKKKTLKHLSVKTGLKSGYWTCSGVSGPRNRKGVIAPAYAQQCWK